MIHIIELELRSFLNRFYMWELFPFSGNIYYNKILYYIEM